MLEAPDVVHVHALARGLDGGGHGVLFAVLAAHAGQGDLWPLAELAALEAIGHLEEGLGDLLLKLAHLITYSASEAAMSWAAKSFMAFATSCLTSSSETAPPSSAWPSLAQIM